MLWFPCLVVGVHIFHCALPCYHLKGIHGDALRLYSLLLLPLTSMSPKSTLSLEAEAAEILRTVDFHASQKDQNALDAAREGEEARRNALLAKELIRKYKPIGTSGRHSVSLQPTTTFPKSSSPRRTAEAEVLSLKLELERCQRALAEEKDEHNVTKNALKVAHDTETTLRADMETMREEWGRKNDELQRELDLTKRRLVTADQDAEMALELAHNNSLAREEIEAWYKQCLERNLELESSLQQQLQLQHEQQPLLQNGTHHLHYENQQMVLASSAGEANGMVQYDEHSNHPSTMSLEPKALSPPKPSSSMVATGRRLWEQSRAAGTRGDTTKSIASVAKRSQERQRQLSERLKSMDDTPQPLALMDSPNESNGRITKLLQDSGRRLVLPGRWWAKTEESSAHDATPESTENLTKHYCRAVEVSVC